MFEECSCARKRTQKQMATHTLKQQRSREQSPLGSTQKQQVIKQTHLPLVVVPPKPLWSMLLIYGREEHAEQFTALLLPCAARTNSCLEVRVRESLSVTCNTRTYHLRSHFSRPRCSNLTEHLSAVCNRFKSMEFTYMAHEL